MPTDDQTLAELGPFFALGQVTASGAWRPLRDLLDGATLDERVTHVRTVLSMMAGADVQLRVAASTMSLGLFARLVSPVFGAVALGLAVPRPSLDGAWWQPVDRGPWSLALTGPALEPDAAGLLTDVVRPIAEALAGRYSLSMRILWGNAASAVFGAAGMVCSARPELSTVAGDIATTLLSGPLVGTGELRESVGDPASGVVQQFVRASCCLYYRIPGGGYCGDCVLAHR